MYNDSTPMTTVFINSDSVHTVQETERKKWSWYWNWTDFTGPCGLLLFGPLGWCIVCVWWE